MREKSGAHGPIHVGSNTVYLILKLATRIKTQSNRHISPQVPLSLHTLNWRPFTVYNTFHDLPTTPDVGITDLFSPGQQW